MSISTCRCVTAADWRKPGHVWEVPYGTLLPYPIGGLLVAGRCMAAAGDAWQVMRIIPAVALTGQVCGVAARLAVERNVSPDELAATLVQAELLRLRIPLHIEDVIHGAG